ncbi:hypothetical protein BGY98DRAFT_957864 [Russula aff. rugulosa BPL654]|nr:hypothetical protein BGY98DRAFT_957864 [Russula aff. rugulosa BPL654]
MRRRSTPFRTKSHDVSYGAISSLYASTAPAAAELNGKYVTTWAPVTLPHQTALETVGMV